MDVTVSENGSVSNVSPGHYVTAGSILVRQRGTHIHAGKNVGVGSDYTLFSTIDGYVWFERKDKVRRKVSVYAERPDF